MLEGVIVKLFIGGLVLFVGAVLGLCLLNTKHAAEQDRFYSDGFRPPRRFLAQARHQAQEHEGRRLKKHRRMAARKAAKAANASSNEDCDALNGETQLVEQATVA